MTPIELELTELAAHLELPPTPDVSTAVAERIARRRPPRRRTLVLGFAAVLVAVASLFAISPSARSALLEWLGIRGVTIERVPELPEVRLRAAPSFGKRVSLEVARSRVDFEVRVPRLDGLPRRAVYLSSAASEGLVTIVYGRRVQPRLVLSQWRGNTRAHFHKLVSRATTTRRLRVNGGQGIWVSGAPHLIFFLDPSGGFGHTPVYLVGNVLVWMEGPISHRLEADVPLDEALRIAASLTG